ARFAGRVARWTRGRQPEPLLQGSPAAVCFAARSCFPRDAEERSCELPPSSDSSSEFAMPAPRPPSPCEEARKKGKATLMPWLRGTDFAGISACERTRPHG